MTKGGVFRKDYKADDFPLVCTLQKGHAGPHVAENIFGEVVGSWPQQVEATEAK